MLLYRLFAERLRDEDAGEYLTYGISLYEVIGRTCVLVDECPDVTLNYIRASRLVQQLNTGQLSPLHFREVIEDFIG